MDAMEKWMIIRFPPYQTTNNLHEETLNPSMNNAKKGAFILAWHKKLGHASYGAMQTMIKHNMAHGLPFKFVPKFRCHDCEIAKLTQQPYQLAQHLPSNEKLGLVHTDICGPVPTSMEGYRYFATLTDDATRFKWILPLKTKGEVVTKIMEWLPYAERQCGG